MHIRYIRQSYKVLELRVHNMEDITELYYIINTWQHKHNIHTHIQLMFELMGFSLLLLRTHMWKNQFIFSEFLFIMCLSL